MTASGRRGRGPRRRLGGRRADRGRRRRAGVGQARRPRPHAPLRPRPRPQRSLERQRAEILALLEDADAMHPVFQPLVALDAAEVAGYEALTRFPGTPFGPDHWFEQARRCGLGPALEGRAIASRSPLAGRPAGAFVSVNVSPSGLLSPEVAAALPADLDGIVIELTENETADAAALAGLPRGPAPPRRADRGRRRGRGRRRPAAAHERAPGHRQAGPWPGRRRRRRPRPRRPYRVLRRLRPSHRHRRVRRGHRRTATTWPRSPPWASATARATCWPAGVGRLGRRRSRRCGPALDAALT